MKDGCYMTIGLEVHVQLLTESKMFCACASNYGKPVNSLTCPVCLGLPGSLPIPNRAAVEMAVLLGLSVGGVIANRTKFDRKNYFYPDLPKGYQISQYDQPLCENGGITIRGEWGQKVVRIRRIHLEEDAGKSSHTDPDGTLLDFNRCGVPLVEIVSEPDMESPEEAYAYLMEIRRLVRWLGVCDGNLEEGSLRCDANISVALRGEKPGTPVEVKNLNSFHGIVRALKYESERQTSLIEAGGVVIRQTRLWDAVKNETRPMRSKEEAHDYRYFPEPDLVGIQLDEDFISGIRAKLPELPWQRRDRYVVDLGIKPDDADILTSDRQIADYFEEVVTHCQSTERAVRWVVGEAMRWRKEIGEGERFPVSAAAVGELIRLEASGRISTPASKTILEVMARQSLNDPVAIMSELGLEQQSSEDELSKIIKSVLDVHPNEVARYLKGENKLFGFLMGQIMKQSGGKADPRVSKELLIKALNKAGVR